MAQRQRHPHEDGERRAHERSGAPATSGPALNAAGAREPPYAREQTRRGQQGLDWFTFFCANLQTGFGPFVSVYLTSQKWTQTDIGFVLMLGGLVGLVGQIPGGAIVDAARSKRLVAALSVVAVGLSALLLAFGSLYATILFAWILHALASCTLSPAIASVSLRLVGHAGIEKRLGRNASFASVGGAFAAAGMGGVGYYVSNQAVFLMTAALIVPALFALRHLGTSPSEAPPREPRRRSPGARTTRPGAARALFTDRTLLIVAMSVALFHLANASMLPLVASMLTLRSTYSPTLFIAACLIVPQIMVAILSPVVAARARDWGRRPLLLVCFAALPLRGLCLSLTYDPYLLVMTQVLDGLSASVLGVIIPLVAADVTRKRGGFAMAQGMIGTMMGLGAAFSTTLGGTLADHYGSKTAFAGLTFVAFAGLIVAWSLMPETKPAVPAKE